MKFGQLANIKTVRAKMAMLLYRGVCQLADIFGVWRYPADRDPERYDREILGRIYWHYKSTRPITRAEKGSQLEKYFAETRARAATSLLPKDFQTRSTVKLSAVGDLMCAKGLQNSKGKFYAKVADLIFDADISFANLESTAIPVDAAVRGPKINATREEFEAFACHATRQYTVFSTANNHILDGGIKGLDAIHRQLEGAGILCVGTNLAQEDQRRTLLTSANEIKIGFVAATYGVNNRRLIEDKGYLVNVVPFHRFQGKADLSLLASQIEFCRSKNCDFIVMSLHWGLEFEFFPRTHQVDIAHELVELGVDAIISHHTHTIQPYEIYQPQRDRERKAPIFYGLGNLSSSSSVAYRSVSLITNIALAKGLCGGVEKTLVKSIQCIPVQQTSYGRGPDSYLQLERLNELISSVDDSLSRDYVDEGAEYADLVLGPSWRHLRSSAKRP